MRIPLQTRFMSFFRKDLQKFKIESKPFEVIQPVLASEDEDSAAKAQSSIAKSVLPPYINNSEFQYDRYLDSEILYTNDQIESIREPSAIAAKCVRMCPDILRPGSTTSDLNDILHQEIVSQNAYPSLLGFRHYPKSICTSVNNVACHGIPDHRLLKDGDLLSVAITVYKNGYHGVCGSTFIVGDSKGNNLPRYLRSVAEECLYRGISACRPGALLLDIGAEIGKLARKRHVNVMARLNGHGVGQCVQTYPDVYHVMNNYPGILKPGMFLLFPSCY